MLITTYTVNLCYRSSRKEKKSKAKESVFFEQLKLIIK